MASEAGIPMSTATIDNVAAAALAADKMLNFLPAPLPLWLTIRPAAQVSTVAMVS